MVFRGMVTGLAVVCSSAGMARALELLESQERVPVPAKSGWFLGPYPNAKLPEHVKAEFGKLTVFADHERADEKGVPIYVVNRGRTAKSWPMEGGDTGLVLECFDEAGGTWRRAQAGGISFRQCGNVFESETLRPGLFFTIRGYRPAQGREGKVRFSFPDEGLVSNEGVGLWTEMDVKKAGLRWADMDEHPFARDLWIWDLRLEQDGFKSTERVLAELELMQVWENGELFRAFATAFRAELEKAEKKNTKALVAVDALLAKPSVAGKNPNALFQRCLEVLGASHGKKYGSPEKLQETAWEALGWLGRRQDFTPGERWREVAKRIEERLPEAGKPELQEIGWLLGLNQLAHEHFSSEFLIQTARRYPELLDACASSLAERENWKGLEAIAEGRDLETRLKVFRYYCVEPDAGLQRPVLRAAHGADPSDFWKGCIEASPWRCVETMVRAMRVDEPFHVPPGLSNLLHDQAREFADKAAMEPWPDENGKLRPGLLLYARYVGRDIGRGNRTLHQWRKLGDVRPDGETDEQNRRRKEVAEAARMRLLIAGWDPGDEEE